MGERNVPENGTSRYFFTSPNELLVREVRKEKETRKKKKHIINFRFAASISLGTSTPVPVLWRMHLQGYQYVGMASLSLIFSDRVVAWSFILWNGHHYWQAFAEDIQTPYSFMISGLRYQDQQIGLTKPIHIPTWIPPTTWTDEKEFPGTVPGNSWTSPGKQQKSCTGFQTAERNNSQELLLEPDFLRGITCRLPQCP